MTPAEALQLARRLVDKVERNMLEVDDKRNDDLALMSALCAGLTIESSGDRRYV